MSQLCPRRKQLYFMSFIWKPASKIHVFCSDLSSVCSPLPSKSRVREETKQLICGFFCSLQFLELNLTRRLHTGCILGDVFPFYRACFAQISSHSSSHRVSNAHYMGSVGLRKNKIDLFLFISVELFHASWLSGLNQFSYILHVWMQKERTHVGVFSCKISL